MIKKIIYAAFFALIYTESGYIHCQAASETLDTEVPMDLTSIFQRVQSFGFDEFNFHEEVIDLLLESCSPKGQNYFNALQTSIQGTDIRTIKIYVSGLAGMFSYFSAEMQTKFHEIDEKINANDLVTARSLLTKLTPSYHKFLKLLENYRRPLPNIGHSRPKG